MRAIVLAALWVGCGGSSEPQQHAPADVGVVEVDAANKPLKPAVRTMKLVPLFGESTVENLVIDPTFEGGNPGIGRWFSSYGTGFTLDGPSLDQLVLSSAPVGMALPVGAVVDDPATGSPRVFSLLAQVPGGSGPYVVSVWIATEKPLAVDMTTLVRVSIASATGTGLSGTEIPRESERTIEGRVWNHYRGEVVGPFALGAYLMVRFRPSRNHWYLQAPEVVPKKLVAGEAKMLVGKRFELEPEERGTIAAYHRIPRVQGVPTSTSKAPR